MINITSLTTALPSTSASTTAPTDAAAAAAVAASITATSDADGLSMSTTLAAIIAMDRSRAIGLSDDFDVSPVTLSSDWSRVARLLLLASLAVVGSVGNVFMISAVMVEDHLKKRGNAFLVNVALADLLVTGFVIPASAIVILAGHEDSLSICRFEWTLEALCFLVTALTLAIIAVENYARLCLPAEREGNSVDGITNEFEFYTPELVRINDFFPGISFSGKVLPAHRLSCVIRTRLAYWKILDSVFMPMYYSLIERYEILTPSRVTATTLIIWMIAGSAVAFQSSLNLGPDFCGRRFNGIAIEQVIGASILVLLPALITLILYLRLVLRVRRAIKSSFKPPATFTWDYELTKTNIYSFLLFVIFWLPFGTAVCISTFRTVSARVFYNLAWFALSKSCVNNLLYCVFDRHFRNAYVKLFHYCCCKTTVSFSRRQRGDCSRSDVRLRVHIIHSYASPASCRPNVARPYGKDVYEL